MLGSFELRTDDGVLADVPGARLRGLLIALALEPGHAVSKATLVDWIWGERPPSDAANALQRLVSRLRKALPEGLVEGQTDGYRLRVEPDAVDAVRFERLVGQARNDEAPRRVRLLREALALWRGAAMQEVGSQDSAAFDAAVTRLEGLRLTAMEDRFDAEISLGHSVQLVTELTDLVAAHPVRERLVAALMRALVAPGRDTEALLVYQRTREALADALGVDPSPELSALHVALLRGELGRREEDRKTNLRAELTSFVGKDADVAAVRELIAEHRLTTVIGPGGSGKTRLATETARTLLGDLPDGAWLVELAAIGADGDVAQIDARRARPPGCSARRRTERGTDGPAHRRDPRAGDRRPHGVNHGARAEQLEWLATLEVEHDNIAVALRGALATGEAHGAMRLAAVAGWYWWLGGHKAEGIELITAATTIPGEVSDEIRAMVYALVVNFMTDGPGDQYHAEEWIHKAYRFSQRSQRRNPLLGFVAALERMLQAPHAFLPAFEPLLTDDDPWVRALARLLLGKLRIMLGQDGRDADAYLEMALAEFRALGERWGISFAPTELADRIAVRGEFAGACEHFDQAIAVVTEVGAIEDVVRMRSRQAQLYWLLGDEESSAAAC